MSAVISGACLGPDRYTQQMDDSYQGDHRVHTHA